MITLDGSVIPAIIIFLALIVALNKILFKPLTRIEAERESRTTVLMAKAQTELDNQLGLFTEYQNTVKNARMSAYGRQEELREEAARKRAEVLSQARKAAEQLLEDSRGSIRAEVEAARQQLAREAENIAHGITVTILEKAGNRATSDHMGEST